MLNLERNPVKTKSKTTRSEIIFQSLGSFYKIATFALSIRGALFVDTNTKTG